MPPRTRKSAAAPARVRVRMYQAGFGDNFLISFEYDKALPDGRTDRHVLVDFGTSSGPKDGTTPLQIADLIRTHTGGRIDVVVVTHRHRDHLSAFGSAEVAKRLMEPGYPSLVVRSWTEDPATRFDATGPAPTVPTPTRRRAHGAVAQKSLGLIAALQSAEGFARALANHRQLAAARPGSLGAELRDMAQDQLQNPDAVAQLNAWAEGGRAEYLHYGMRTRIEDIVPGIGVRVLGPPTVDQHPAVAGQREDDPIEFWMIYQGLVGSFGTKAGLGGAQAVSAAAAAADDEPGTEPDRDPAEVEAPKPANPIGPLGPVRWLTDRMQRQQLNSLLRVVRVLDDALNNTSVILLFELPVKGGETVRMLFGGDAQIENWEYALKAAPEKDANLKALRLVDLYKVGHHGSRNATPRTLFNLWTEPGTMDRPMVALMSTKANVHGKSPDTAVPRKTLVAALDTRMKLYSTQKMRSKKKFVEVVADLTAGTGFTEVS